MFPPRAYTTPRVSPDGTRVAVVIDGDIWVTELARPGTLRRVTTDPARERFPLWTPDGERLILTNRTRTAHWRSSRRQPMAGAMPTCSDGDPRVATCSRPKHGRPMVARLFITSRRDRDADEPTGNNFNIGMLSMTRRRTVAAPAGYRGRGGRTLSFHQMVAASPTRPTTRAQVRSTSSIFHRSSAGRSCPQAGEDSRAGHVTDGNSSIGEASASMAP